ncbi:hypothetical protein B0H16DRAFT_1470327 [Mycena metata]|uniref:Uncharacterized protein n=1 Tax=Mycena metata TaxID=1033252 RepID=A0AAD7MSE6_9AGAR|nr:hypothetical protein B0H16DRAFT_1470327 [Mycena metata]
MGLGGPSLAWAAHGLKCKSSDKAMIIARVGKARTGEARQGQPPNHPNPAAIRPKNPFFRPPRGTVRTLQLLACRLPDRSNPAVMRPKNPFFRPLRGAVHTLQLLACRSLKSSGNAPQKPIFPPAARRRTHAAAASVQAARSLKSSGNAPQKPIFSAAARRRTQAWATQDPVMRDTWWAPQRPKTGSIWEPQPAKKMPPMGCPTWDCPWGALVVLDPLGLFILTGLNSPRGFTFGLPKPPPLLKQGTEHTGLALFLLRVVLVHAGDPLLPLFVTEVHDGVFLGSEKPHQETYVDKGLDVALDMLILLLLAQDYAESSLRAMRTEKGLLGEEGLGTGGEK